MVRQFPARWQGGSQKVSCLPGKGSETNQNWGGEEFQEKEK